MKIQELMRQNYRSVPISFLGLGALALAVFVFCIFVPQIFGPGETDFVVKSGESLRVVASNLKEQDLIKSKTLFVVYGLVLGKDRKLKPGIYQFSGNQNSHSILMAISGNGGNNDVRITIPEGFNIWEIDNRLAKIGVTLPGEIFNFRGQEGWLFPDTYNFTRGDTPLMAIGRMNDNFSFKTAQIQAEAAKQKRNWQDVVIMASILEKEARGEEDMRLVADVLWKRFDAGMELEVDATVAYGVCLREGKDCVVSKVPIRVNLDIDSRYNTYKYPGLPPGPISNPGLQALKAALNPKPSPNWYYLSTMSGQMLFSKTGDEHEKKRATHILGQ